MGHLVLTLGGLNKGRIDRLDDALRGYSMRPGHQRVVVKYPQEGSAESILEGVAALERAVDAALLGGYTFDIEAMSQGAEVYSEWAERHAKRPDAPLTGQLRRVLLIGNPCRKYGGVATGTNWILRQGYLGERQPTPITQYRTDDIARQGDEWANVDGWWNGKASGKRPKVGLLTKLFNLDPHVRYERVDPDNPGQLRATEGNTRFWVAP